MRWLSLILILLAPAAASARSWCAKPLYVHEWGVQAFDSSGTRESPARMPRWFHDAEGAPGGAAGVPVRNLGVDSGDRYLPVLHFYVGHALDDRTIPVGIAVGFTQGEASLWYPQVDARRRAAIANTPQTITERAAIMQQRQARWMGPATPERDPTRQLFWDRLLLSNAPVHRAHRSRIPWVRSLRAFDSLWVSGASESERFVFYEAQTTERFAITMTRGNTWTPQHRHLVLHNGGTHAVHDVFLTHREGRARYVVYVPSIPAGRSAGVVLDEHRVPRREFEARTRGALRAQLVDGATPHGPPPTIRHDPRAECVMGRNPSMPVDRAEGHRLYEHEADAIIDIWGAAFFHARGTTVLYREDIEYIDRVMPLSIHTDMYHFPRVRRTGLAVWKNASLPSE